MKNLKKSNFVSQSFIIKKKVGQKLKKNYIEAEIMYLYLDERSDKQ